MWEPIETAPKDGTAILLFVPNMQGYPDNPRILSAFWGICGWTDNGAVECQTWGNPTHWMPLPPPPVLAERHNDWCAEYVMYHSKQG